MIRTLLLLLALSLPTLAAVAPEERLADPALEARARDLSRDLRCPVCQNESIDASNADLARDLRRLVRERLAAGDSDQQVLDFLVARYGDFVLMRPPVRSDTWALWFLPAGLLAVAGVGVVLWLRRPRPATAALTVEEEARIDRLLDDAAGGAR